MREQVCIVLNEREPSKARAADTLTARLKDYNITSSRIPADKNVLKTAIERSPAVLVLDYLLGDYTTGLDVFSGIKNEREKKPPAVFFLTDEPSVSVAVEAMRLGARDYLELESPQALTRLARAIHELLLKGQEEAPPPETQRVALSDLVDNSPAASKLFKQARVITSKRPPIIVLHGNKGTGRRTLARALHTESGDESLCTEIDLAIFSGIFGRKERGTALDLPGFEPVTGSTTIILNPECDDGSCHSYFCENAPRIWPAGRTEDCETMVIVCTDSPETLAVWRNFPGAEVLRVPSLSHRKEDIPFLIQRFLREVRAKQFSGSLLNLLQGLDWPGEISQLRACVINTAISTTFSDDDPKSLIEEQRAIWEESRTAKSNLKLNRFTAARVLELSCSNYRIAAARLGCPAARLKELIDG